MKKPHKKTTPAAVPAQTATKRNSPSTRSAELASSLRFLRALTECQRAVQEASAAQVEKAINLMEASQ